MWEQGGDEDHFMGMRCGWGCRLIPILVFIIIINAIRRAEIWNASNLLSECSVYFVRYVYPVLCRFSGME